MRIKQSSAWWLDAIIFIGFLAAFFLSLTGLELHQWIGVMGGSLALYHFIVHWGWVSLVNRRFF